MNTNDFMSETENTSIIEFMKNHVDCYKKNKKQSKYKIIMESNGIGWGLTIKCCSCKMVKDVTDYSCW